MPPAPGSPAPDFEVALPGGASLALADFRGGALVLVFLRHLA